MALKDWKKRSSNTWYNEKKDKFLEIEFEESDREIFPYEVIIIDKRNFSSGKVFKLKSQALKFAKSYMRKH